LVSLDLRGKVCCLDRRRYMLLHRATLILIFAWWFDLVNKIVLGCRSKNWKNGKKCDAGKFLFLSFFLFADFF
jgi:hypothetical protein